MHYEFSSEASCPLVLISLSTNEEVNIERGSMVFHNNKVSITGRMNQNGSGSAVGGIIRAAARSLTSGESFFITTAKGTAPDGLIAVAPKSVGNIKALEVGKTSWRLNDGVFLASDSTVTCNMKMQPLTLRSAVFGSNGGLFIMETSGTGTVLVNSFGEIVELMLDGQDTLVVDNIHVVAWENTLSYEIKTASGLMGWKTGEGLVNVFTGCGRLLIQTRNTGEFVNTLQPYLPKK